MYGNRSKKKSFLMKSNFTFAAIKEKEKMFFLIFLTKKRNKKYEYKNQRRLLQLIDT